MAGPAVIGGIGLASTLIGGIMQGKGKQQSYEAQSQVYNYQSQVAKINSDIDKQNADYALNKGEQQATIAGMKGAQELGHIKAGQAASGFDVNKGSNVDVQVSQRKVTQMDMDQIRANASKVAYDYNVKSVEDINQAGLYTMASSNASQAGNLALTSSLVSTAGSVADKWLSSQQSGLFNG